MNQANAARFVSIAALCLTVSNAVFASPSQSQASIGPDMSTHAADKQNEGARNASDVDASDVVEPSGTTGNAASKSGAARNAELKNNAAPVASKTGDGAEEAASEGVWSAGGEIDVNSRYVWRGLALSQGAVVQPSFWVSWRDYTFSVWSNGALRGGRGLGANRFNEVDVTLSRSLQWKKWTVEPGFQWYLYPHSGSGAPTGVATGEASLRLSRNVGGSTFYTEHALDVIRYGGAYFALIGVSREHAFRKRLSGTASLGFGFGSSRFNRVNIGARGAAFNVVMLDAALTYALGAGLSLRPHLGLSTLPTSRLRDQVEDPTLWVLGVALEGEM